LSDGRADTVVVFVHGIFGDTLGTWENAETGKHFYDLLAADPKFSRSVDIFAFGYPSALFDRGSFTLQEAANRLAADLQFYNVEQYHKLVFVAHSMGGLVVLRMLLTHRDLIQKVPLVMLFATPQEGSQITVLARRLLNNPSLAEMLPSDYNTYLQTLNDEWRSLPARQTHVSCAYEKRSIAGITIVPWSSATRFCDDPALAVNADHIEIVKPSNSDSDSYIALSNALMSHVFTGANESIATNNVPNQPTANAIADAAPTAAANDVNASVPIQPVARDYAGQFSRDRTDELLLARDAEQAFALGNYDWTIKFLVQAKAVQTSGVWQSSYPFLYGAQLATGKLQDAAKTRAELLDAVTIAVNSGGSYLSHQEPLGMLIHGLGTVRRNIPDKYKTNVDDLIDKITTLKARAM
jgi:pimeloyl-ACP methyl ester carboxylesterase